ncbi:MAG: [protein-PII] uridylyltransferase [Actinobacteria bacterium]|nr:[protein-PII] uridylyltransferase [Actinomycetota bacterium]
MAVGSHGRGDAAPHSDLDLVLVHRGRRDIKVVADRLWYPIWDSGIGLDHSVRTVKEALAVADGDLKAMLGLLDVRLVAGDPALADELASKVAAQWRTKAKRWLPALAEAVAHRHERFGEVAYLLEPDLKEGSGGLRDVHALWAAARATPVLAERLHCLDQPHCRLSAVRAALHRRAGKCLDRLLLQEQDGVAEVLGFPGADELMAEVSAAARTIAYTSDDGWERVAAWLAGPAGRRRSADRPVAPGVQLRDGEIVVTDPAGWLRAAVAAAQMGVPLDRTSLAAVAPEAPAPPDPWPAPWRQNLVALLGAGPPALAVLEALDQHDLLVRLLPEWETVRYRPQRNAYHRFTVDRHLWEAAIQAAALTRRVARPDLLLVGALLHDIGKGYPGDHTDAGVEVVSRLAPRIGFPPADVAVLVDLVRHHLLLPDVATRRDLSDPATANAVAAAVGDVSTLELLAALTEADSLATGPAAWSEWKASLVRELVERTRAVLSGRRIDAPGLGEALEAVGEGVGEGVHVDGNRCTVVAPDRPGLFSKVAGVLALHGLDVRSATVAPDRGGRAVEVFEVEPAFDRPPRWDKVAADIEAVLAGRLALESRLADRARSYARHYRRTAATTPAPRVLVDNTASARATVVEVRAPDGVAVLHRITAALAACGLDVREARVATLGHEVVDAFYVVDSAGAKVTDDTRLAAIEEAVLARLAAGSAAGI